jgi:ATP-dependent Lhr-like helicase
MLPKQSFRKRLPLWLNRLRAKKLLDAVSRQKDFPLVLEAWRECLEDELDVETLQKLLAEVEGGEIQVVCATTAAPSPFASGVLWQLTNELMYEDDVPETAGPTVTTDLLREVALSERLRPRIPRKIIEELEEKMQRTFSGYSPQSARELVDWVRERELIPAAEWSRLLDAMERDHHIEASEVATETAPHLVAVRTRDEAGIKAIMVPEAAVALASAFGLTPADLPLGSPTGEKRPSRESLGAVETLWSRNTESRLEPAGVEELAELLGQVLRFHGPISQGRLRELLSPSPEHDELVTEAIGELETGERVVFDRVSEGAASPEVCDIDNLERLLRLTRQASRKRLEPLELDALPLLLAIHQGLARQPEPAPANPADRTEESKEDLRQALEPLFGYPARADLWETEILPARLKRYLPSHLEELVHKERLEWVGCGKKTLTLTLEDERELFQDGAETPSMPADLEETLDHLFPAGSGRFSFEELAARSSLSAQRLTETLWQLAWAGRITTDSFETVRRGVRARFRSAGGPERSGELAGRSKSRARRRRGGARWRPRAVLPGAWHRLSPVDPPEDPLDRDELARERARLLFDRYPVVFRELVQRELPALSWKNLFRALRLMELSGEVLSGCFLRGPTGPQFASKQTYELLRRGLPGDRVYWMNAADPASACGLRLEGFSTKLPARLPTTHLVYHGTDLVLCSRRTGGELTIRVEPGHPRLAEYLDFLRLRLTRSAHPAKRVVVEEINGEPAASSPYAEALSELVEVSRERTSLCLMRRY